MRKLLYRRAWWVSNSRDGFHLSVIDRRLDAVLAEAVVNGVLAALGHPCCGRGLGRIPGVDHLAYRLLNCPNRLARHDVRVAEIPLTTEQALTIQPDLAEATWWRDKDEDSEEKEEAL